MTAHRQHCCQRICQLSERSYNSKYNFAASRLFLTIWRLLHMLRHFDPPFFRSLENLYRFNPYILGKMRKMSYFDPYFSSKLGKMYSFAPLFWPSQRFESTGGHPYPKPDQVHPHPHPPELTPGLECSSTDANRLWWPLQLIISRPP